MFEQENRYKLHWHNLSKRLNETTEVSPDFLNLIEPVFFDGESFDASCFKHITLEEVFDYLKQSHVYYLEVGLPKIENTLQELAIKFGDRYLSIRILLVFLEKYRTALVKHILQEEEVLFLFVENMLNGVYSTRQKDFVLNHFLHTHNDNVIIQLKELRKDLLTFDEELKENLTFSVLFNQLECFQHDLAVHGLIEDNVFIHKVLIHIHENFESLHLGELDKS